VKHEKRGNFLKYLKKNNIYPGIHYPIPNHLQKPFIKFTKTKLPITEKISKEIVSIPIYPFLSTKQINKIIKVINKF
jgi:dTDP-4-amino-4,6-dideoxygalactose transaminase